MYRSLINNTIYRRAQRGSMLVMALFLLVVLTLLAGTMITIVSGSSKSVVHEVYGLRAQYAAQAGLENLIAQSFPAGSTAQVCNTNTSSTPSFSGIDGFRNCRFDAQCTSQEINFNGSNHRFYRYASTGFCDTGDGVVSRTLFVDAMQENVP
jgi:MSHA biogenesis protein MshP